jgi:phosphatidylserine decarboxylase
MLYSILYVLPKNLLSYVFGVLAAIPWPFFLREPFIYFFAKFYKIDLYEADRDIPQYKSLNDFFTRKLKQGIRPIEDGVIHPADSTISQAGRIQEGTLIQAKGKSYFLKDFLGKSSWLYDRFEDGYFVTYYLCPTDYHRVHSPVDGYIIEVNYIPGQLWPVNSWSVDNIDQLFSINERVVVTIETPKGFCSLVMVGATNVGQITLSFDPGVRTNRFWSRKPIFKKYTTPISIKKGDEVGIFHLGSTVVMVYEKTFFSELKIQTPQKVRLGERLDQLKNKDTL